MSKMYNSYTPPSKEFTIIANKLIRSPNLSCKAFKLLAIGLSNCGAWKFNKVQVGTCFKEKAHTIDEAMKELRSLGYLHTIARKAEDTKFEGHIWFWFADPISEEEFKKSFRNSDFPGVGNFGDSENHPDIRKPILKNTKEYKNNNPPPAKAPSAVVIPSSLSKLKIPESLKQKITKEQTKEDIDLAVERAMKWKGRPNDEVGLMTALASKDTWIDRESLEDIKSKNEAFLKTLEHLDSKEISLTRIVIGRTYVEFSRGMHVEIYNVDDKDFIIDVKKCLKTLRIIE